MLFCNLPFSYASMDESNPHRLPYNLGHVFEVLNQRKEQGVIESYSVSQTTLEQIFVQLAGEDEEAILDGNKNSQQGS
jgi:hypothetical protein